jgi:hypothetical protein
MYSIKVQAAFMEAINQKFGLDWHKWGQHGVVTARQVAETPKKARTVKLVWNSCVGCRRKLQLRTGIGALATGDAQFE